MELNKPLGESLFANFLAGPQILPMPSTALTVSGSEDFSKQPIGNGPYKMDTPWTPNQSITLVKNPDYKGSTPGNADQIDFRVYNDDNAAWADLQAGNLDILGVSGLPQQALATAEQVLGDRYVNTAGALQFGYYAFPQQTDTFKNKDVRIAIRKAINYQDIVDKLLYGTATVAQSFAPSTIPGGGTDICGDSCVFDAAKAKQLLQSTLDQYKTGLVLTELNFQNVRPPQEVKDAFDDANRALQDKQRLEEEAKAYLSQVVPEARGDAASARAEAEGYKSGRIARAEGDAQRFNLVEAQYRAAPEVTRKRLYLETMQEVVGHMPKIIDSTNGKNLLSLPLPAEAKPLAPPVAAGATVVAPEHAKGGR